MRIEELELVCQEAARNVVTRQSRPLRPSVVLPLPDATRVVALPDWPDDDSQREHLLQRFADEMMRPVNAACFGFVAEATAGGDEVVVVVFGARRTGARVMAAPLEGDQLGDFVPSEPLDASAMPFLAPLRAAADEASPPDAFGVS